MKSNIDFFIIADFLSPLTKERVIYELSSPKKKIKAFERFSHNCEAIIKAEYVYYKGSAINDTIKAEIKKSVSECIVLSFEYQQGKKMFIDEALDYLTNECIFAVIANENWLIIKPEYECGKELFYVLKKE